MKCLKGNIGAEMIQEGCDDQERRGRSSSAEEACQNPPRPIPHSPSLTGRNFLLSPKFDNDPVAPNSR